MSHLRIGLTQRSEQVIRDHAARPSRLLDALSGALQQGLIETESHIKANKLSGAAGSGGGGNTPVGLRSGTLRQALSSELDEPLGGYVGVTQGPASKYAPTILGEGTTTIRPKSANHLWIPIADNLNPSGQARLSPREAMSRKGPRGGRLLSIFESKRGNLVAVLRDKVPGVRRKSGKLLFVLKKQITIEGTGALREGAEEKTGRIRELLEIAISDTMGGTA